MAKISSGLYLSSDFFLNNFYSNNRNVIKKNNRNDYSKLELSYEDSRALSKAAKRLPQNDYGSKEEDTKDDNINDTTKASIQAFVSVYNNTLDSGKSSTDYDTQHYIKRLRTMTKNHADELEDIGITIEKDGKLTVNEDLLKISDNSKVEKIFSSDNEFSKQVMKFANKLNFAIQNDIYSQINGKGLHINITM
ncbi:MAG: hypothetical protein PUF65_04900 [Lachnospiraceae bacterium]|nr:hypothetical protein [Lachnospiraceae bacterium]